MVYVYTQSNVAPVQSVNSYVYVLTPPQVGSPLTIGPVNGKSVPQLSVTVTTVGAD